MWRVALLAIAGIGAALAIVVWRESRVPVVSLAATTAAAPTRSAVAAPSAARLEKLETDLRSEAERRKALEQRVAELDAAVAKLRAATPNAAADPRADATSDGAEGAGPGTPPATFRNRFRPRAETEEERIDKLVAAGFSAERAAYIEQRRSELALQALEQQYTARRDGQPVPPAPSAARHHAAHRARRRRLRALPRCGREADDRRRVQRVGGLAGRAGRLASRRRGHELRRQARLRCS